MSDTTLTSASAEEFTQALEAVLEGNAMSLSGAWRLRADAIKRDVPEALGMTRREWVDRLAARFGRYRITDDRRPAVTKLLHEEGMKDRAIADALGIGKDTVARDLGHRGADAPPVADDAAPTDDDAATNGADAPPDPEDLAAPVAPATDAEHARQQRKDRDKNADAKRLDRDHREAAVTDVPEPDIRTGTLREALANVDDVDLVFTDPPYPREHLDAWTELAAWATRALKPGALLVAYSGQYHLPEVITRLREHLTYQWLGWIATTGPQVAVHQRPVMSGGKPLLIFSNGPLREPFRSRRFYDFAAASGRTRTLHTWQQDEAPAAYYIDTLTERGELVVDPFLGSGTFAAVAARLDRRFIGCDTDTTAITTTHERLAG